MHRSADTPAGTVRRLVVDSEAVADNLLGDPHRRRVDVYLPPGHDGRGLPLLVDLVGFTAGGPAHSNWRAFTENVPERLDRLIAAGAMPPVVCAFPDCFTRLGGNQYINSAAMGRWEDFLLQEMLPAVEAEFGCGGDGRRGVFGKSSGGYGAIVHAMRHGGTVWAAAACHSGDMAFEMAYLPDFPALLRQLAKHDNSIVRFIEAFEAAPKRDDRSIHALMALAMAATYDPDPGQPFGIRLPVDLRTAEVIDDRWANWLAWDPVVLARRPPVVDRLRTLKGLFIDCGTEDQYNLVYGARRLNRILAGGGVRHRYEEFDDNHMAIDYRMDVSLPYLAAALSE